jgi:hypothetical protein
MRILVIPDLHAPAVRPGFMQFCSDLRDQWDCNKVIFLGDVIDWHAISFWTRHPELPGPRDEYKLACQEIEKWSKEFPIADVCIGNHDERPARLAKTVNIPEFMLRPYNEIWPAKKWNWARRFRYDDTVFMHGTGCSGIHPAWNLMNSKMHESVAIGHCHTRAGIKWSSNKRERKFGMDCGCGIDEEKYNFAYSHDDPIRPFLSAAVIIDGVPYLEPMRCSRGEPYHDSKFTPTKGAKR